MLLLQCIFAQEPEFPTYKSKDFRFSIQYPSDWKKEKENMSKSSNVILQFHLLNKMEARLIQK